MNTVWVGNNNKVKIVCPKCGFDTDIDVTKLNSGQRTKKAKCKCGEIFQFTIEFRKKYRKDVRLPGDYTIQGKGEKGDIIIRELSLIGIRFECLSPHHILKDDTVKVKFKLDDPKRSEIQKPVKVIWVKDRNVGADFIETKLYEKDLGFYLNF